MNSNNESQKMTENKELIILSAPNSKDKYYNEFREEIFDFLISYSKEILKKDDVIILVDENNYEKYKNEIGANNVFIKPMKDIWFRDFGFSNIIDPLLFRYSSSGQGGGKLGKKYADEVQIDLLNLANLSKLKFKKTDLINDGGNWVDDYHGNVVISRKFLRDNKLDEASAREILSKTTNVKNIAFIDADEQGGLEHADGVVSFIDENTLIINNYNEDQEYSNKLKKDLRSGLSNVRIYEIITPYNDKKIFDERFGSACGLYTNALVTPNRIYLPQFGIKEDEIALKQISKITNKEIIPIPSSKICEMGGGVRCMSWQLRGFNAKSIRKYLEQER